MSNDDIMSDEDLAELEALLGETDSESEPETEPETQTEAEPEPEIVAETEVETAPEPAPEPVAKKPAAKKRTPKANNEDVEIDLEQFRKDVLFNENTIDEAFMSQAALYAHYGVLSARLNRKAEEAKAKLELVESKIAQELREEAEANGKKPVETAIAKQLKLDSRCVKQTNAVSKAKEAAEIAKHLTEAFKQRRDMLIQKGADMREEFKGDLRMKEAEARSSSIANARKVVGA